jgi:hypothetical protein
LGAWNNKLMSRVGPFFMEKIRLWHDTLSSCEPNWVFYRRKSLFACEEYNNSSHESSYRQAKYGFAAVSAMMDVHQLGHSLSIQANVSYQTLKSHAEKNLNRYCGWSSNPELSSQLTKRGAGLTKVQWNWRYNYRSMYDAQECKLWVIVTDVYQETDSADTAKIPFVNSFSPNVRCLGTFQLATTKDGGKCLQCSCCYPQCMGPPCCHQLHVLVTYFDGYAPKLEDVHPFWWTSYFIHAFKRDVNGGCFPPFQKL